MERIIYKHVYNHLIQNKLIYQYQSGFLPKHSSVHQLIELYNTILNSLEKKELCCFVFCDFSKAFDKVWHKGLIHKMNCYGIKGNLLKWFENYLYCRHQKVVNRDSSSSYVSVSAGVPQGSVLGPLLFLVYINDIGDKLLSLSRLFADDTSLGYASQDEDQIKYVINHDLHELGDWSKRWLMSFNPDKTEIMLFKNVENSTNFYFYFDGKLIPLTSDHKHLGITFSEEAKWNKHVENLIKSVSKHICVLRKLKYKLNRKNLEKLYLIYIRPIFEYACEVWDNCGVSNSCKLVRLQLEAVELSPDFQSLPTHNIYIVKLAGRDWKKEQLGESSNYYIISKTVAHPLIYSILSHQQSKVRLCIPFEMATILLFHSVDYL